MEKKKKPVCRLVISFQRSVLMPYEGSTDQTQIQEKKIIACLFNEAKLVYKVITLG